MIPLVLAVAFAGSYTPETACVEHDLQVMLNAPSEKSVANRVELDRRIADVLYAEREAETSAVAKPRAWLTDEAAPAALGLLGLLVVAIAAGRRSRALAVAGALAIAGAGVVARAPIQKARDLHARIGEIRNCRIRLNEVRTMLEHGDYSRCLADIGEADEDLLLFQATLQSGGQIKLEQITKLRSEMTHQPGLMKK